LLVGERARLSDGVGFAGPTKLGDTGALTKRGTLWPPMTALTSLFHLTRGELERQVNALRYEKSFLVQAIRSYHATISATASVSIDHGLAMRRLVESMSRWKAVMPMLDAAERELSARPMEPPASDWDEPTETSPERGRVTSTSSEHRAGEVRLPMFSARRLAERLS
jgi:hypothetical protein